MSDKFSFPEKLILASGDEVNLLPEDANAEDGIRFENGDTSIAVICPDGTLTAYSQGTTEITVISEGCEVSRIRVTVDREIPHSALRDTTLMFTGEISTGEAAGTSAARHGYDLSYIFSPEIKTILSRSDLNICAAADTCDDRLPFNLETAGHSDDRLPFDLETAGHSTGALNPSPTDSYHAANSPSTLMKVVCGAGFNIVCTAGLVRSEKSMDSLEGTCDLINEFGMNQAGSMNSNPVIRKLGHLRIAFINLAMYPAEPGINAAQAGEAFGYYSDSYAEKLISKAQSKSVDLIITLMNWGQPGSTEVTAMQRITATQLAEAGADLIIGYGTGTLQAYEEIHTSSRRIVPCLYSLGNFYTAGLSDREKTTGAIAKVVVTEDSEGYSCHLSLIPVVSMSRGGVSDEVTARVSGEVTSVMSAGVSRGVTAVVPARPSATRRQHEASEFIKNIYPEMLCDPFCGRSVLFLGSKLLGRTAELTQTPHVYDLFSSDALMTGLYDYVVIDAPDLVSEDDRAVQNFLTALGGMYPGERIILTKLRTPEFVLTDTGIISSDPDASFASALEDMEQRIIDTLHPIVIDYCDLFLGVKDNDMPFALEYHYHKQTAGTIDSMVSGRTNNLYYSERDLSVWMERILKYGDLIKASPYAAKFFPDGDAADRIIQASDSVFVWRFRSRLLALKRAHAELPYVENIIRRTPEDADFLNLVTRLCAET